MLSLIFLVPLSAYEDGAAESQPVFPTYPRVPFKLLEFQGRLREVTTAYFPLSIGNPNDFTWHQDSPIRIDASQGSVNTPITRLSLCCSVLEQVLEFQRVFRHGERLLPQQRSLLCYPDDSPPSESALDDLFTGPKDLDASAPAVLSRIDYLQAVY